MKFDRIKISMEFNVMGNGLWLTGECPVAPEEDVLEEFKKGRDLLVQSFKAMDEASFYVKKNEQVDPKADEENMNKFYDTRNKLVKAKTKEEAEQILNESGFRFNLEFKEIVHTKKQSKFSNNGKVNQTKTTGKQ